MTLEQHINKWNGQKNNFDGTLPGQCMDEMHFYISEVLGLTDPRILAAPVARTVFENFPNVFGNQYFERIYNNPSNIPVDGDIIFWKEPYGKYFNTTTQKWEYAGHVGISKGSNVNNIVAFEQNNPTRSPCHIEKHTDLYKGVLGWLHFKAPQVDKRQEILNQIDTQIHGGTSLDSKVSQIKFLTGQL